ILADKGYLGCVAGLSDICSSLGTDLMRDGEVDLRRQPLARLNPDPGPAISCAALEQIPKELVVDFVVILHLGRFDESTQLTRTAVRRSLFEISIAALHVRSEKGRGPFSLAKVVERRINVVRQIALRLTQVLDLCGFSVDSSLENRIHDEVRISVRRYGANFHAHALFVSDGDTDHRAAINSRSLDLVGRFKVRVETAISVHAGIEQKADVISVSKDAVEERPPEFAEFLFAFGIPEQVVAIFANGNVCVHAVPVDAHDRLGQEADGQLQLGSDLATDQFVELDLIGGRDDLTIAIIDFKLRRCDFRVILLVLEAHRPLHFRGRVDERTQRIAGEGMVVASGVHVVKCIRLMITTLRVRALKQEAFNLIRGIQRVALFLVQVAREALQKAANVGSIGRAVLVDDVTKNKNLASAKDVRRRPVKCVPANTETQVALALRRKTADGRAVKGEVVPALDEELLVVIQHVQATFKVAEQHSHSLDALFVGEILQARFLDLVNRHAILALLLRLQIQLLQFVIREFKKITQFVSHESP